MTRTKTAKTKKVTGVVSALGVKQIRVNPPKGKIWQINRTPTTKVTVIRGKPLRLGSEVTVEFNIGDAKQSGTRFPGKRTETGTVIGLTAQLITLGNTQPDPGPWIIIRTDDNTKIILGTLTLGSTVRVEFNEPPGHQVVA